MQPLLQREQVRIGAAGAPSVLTLPADAPGLVLFTLGSDAGGSADHPARHDEFVANALHAHGVGSLLPERSDATAGTGRVAADVERQTRCIDAVLVWATRHPATAGLRLGVFGTGAGAAAALRAAADHANAVCAVVACSGRPDLAGGAALQRVEAPTLLIVGGADADALARNRQAMRQMGCRKRLEVVPGASSRFLEPGTLDTAAHLAGAWFATHLTARCDT
ncbi:MAG: alpha/beta hydrolase [Rhizobacter sp.]|nr:alpha/beta hydrolase [Rhizobacter sp.]